MKKDDLDDFIRSLERKELTEEQQVLLSFGGNNPAITVNNNVAGCSTTNNCNDGNCGNCVKGCGSNN